MGVVFIDLDRFKNINDSMGHHVGDALLCSVARQLLLAVRSVDTVCRMGGDEFVVVLSDVASREEIAQIVDERMLPLIREPHSIDGQELEVACSAGIAVYPEDGEDVDHLMRHADAAMYQAKSAGRDRTLFFTAEFHHQAQRRLAIETALRRILDRNELELHYQPRVEASTGRVLGVEALVRWTHPELGALSPAHFIPIAEECGLIIPIGAWILHEACRQHATWIESGLGAIAISVNVSAVQLRDRKLPEAVASALSELGVISSFIELELTETFLMENASATVECLLALKAVGVTLSIDDFGTGYSSLNYLHQFPIDKLKIDQSFVRDIVDDPADLAITRAIIGLGQPLGLRVVAEGVEREEERALLLQAGCDELQGYLFAKPMADAQFREWLASQVVAKASPPRARLLPRALSPTASVACVEA